MSASFAAIRSTPSGILAPVVTKDYEVRRLSGEVDRGQISRRGGRHADWYPPPRLCPGDVVIIRGEGRE